MKSKYIRGLLGAVSLGLILNGVRPIYESVTDVPLGEIVLSPKFPSVEEMMNLYVDCDHKIYTKQTFSYTKNPEEILQGVEKRKNLEGLLRRYFNQQTRGEFHDDNGEGIYDPLDGKGTFENSFSYTRIREGRWKELHGGIDMFAPLDSKIYAPIEGVVVASSDDWRGRWDKRKGFVYESGGLSRLSGNGIILFSPSDTTYYFMVHMKDVFAKTGDVVSEGQIIGTVGKTGNAISTPPHLHLAWKKAGTSCETSGVLVALNSYQNLRAARRILNANDD